MSFVLMAHQKEGVDFLAGSPAGLLAFEQGLGKTLVAIEAFRRVRSKGDADQLLVICPTSLKRNWLAELRRFAPELDVAIAEGKPKERRLTFSEPRAEVVITSYETARAEITAVLALAQRRRTAMVLDESHAAKNWSSRTSTAAREFAPHCTYRWLLSGTPVTNSPEDLYTQVEILAPGKRLLGSRDYFTAMMAQDPEGAFARDALSSLVLRRTKDQCLDLPEKLFVDLRVELPDWQRRAYDKARSGFVSELQGLSDEEYRAYSTTALARLMRLIQLASNPAVADPTSTEEPGKFLALSGLVDQILTTPGRKLIVWSNFVRSIETLLERFAKHGAVALYGGTPQRERQDVARRFQNDDQVRVLIGNPAAAGTGFTLTAAAFTIYETLSWRYDHFAQSQDRNHRIGQELPVTYVRLIADDTIEEAVVSALQRKSAMARTLLGDPKAEGSISELSRDELLELVEHNRLPRAA